MKVKFKFTLGIGYAGSYQEEVLELDDNLTEEEIYKELDEWMYEHIDSGYEIIED